MSRFFVVGLLAVVGCCCNVSRIDVSSVNEKVEGEALSAKLAEVGAQCDHTPVYDPKECHQFVFVHILVENKTDKPWRFRISHIYASLDVDKLGCATTVFRVLDPVPNRSRFWSEPSAVRKGRISAGERQTFWRGQPWQAALRGSENRSLGHPHWKKRNALGPRHGHGQKHLLDSHRPSF